jgi:hypothetical protein
LLAIVLAGGAGLALAGAIVAPGQRRRAAALGDAAPDALAIAGDSGIFQTARLTARGSGGKAKPDLRKTRKPCRARRGL